MPPNAPIRFKPKVDAWLPVLLGFEMFSMTALLLVLALTMEGPEAEEIRLALPFIVAVNLLVIGIMYGLRYRLTETDLAVMTGPFRWMRVPLSEIEAVEPARGLASTTLSFATTTDRLRVTYRRNGQEKAVLIGPKDKAAFLKTLVERVPHLEVREGKLLRAQSITS